MTNVKWDPFRNVAALQDRINRMFDDSFEQAGSADEMSSYGWRPSVDIYEVEAGIVIKADLPGVRKEDVSVEVKDNLLTLKGMREGDAAGGDQCYFCQERNFGQFQRTFTLQYNVDPGKIKASFKSGVLKITVPEPEEEQPRKIRVNID
ncbi:MAG: Hsp20/alpha crystallin family protein [Desulfobacterales bacterium]|nr:Hsp20/alpha crystallin family protein [Desulfobacterales bacterium]